MNSTDRVRFTAQADQLAAELRDRKPRNHPGCDAFDPCHSCRTGRTTVVVLRHLSRTA